ncbi:tubulin epsilon and delta complex protein 2 isoform X2 [Mixophyes fleayi]|uniref:tubulin epsilon and delta complex protein 2 isoform X2 n=1 Tax=Mixophyes fleayi TaxID=3061075 RepID=UPI003F4D7526
MLSVLCMSIIFSPPPPASVTAQGAIIQHFLTGPDNHNMLSSSCSHRLLSLLNQALLSCKEEEKQLEEHLRRSRLLLGGWNTAKCETFTQDDKSTEPQESQPSPEELQEVELLNKALEKAMRVRGKSRTESPVVKAPPTTQTTSSCPSTKVKVAKPLNRLLHTGSKPVTYQLHPPYKTIPDKRVVRAPGRGPSNDKTARLTPLEQPAVEKGNGGKDKQPQTRANPIGTKPDSPPSSDPDGATPRPQKPFTLKDNGTTLKLPVEYRQEYMRNSRLWEKFYEIQDHVPASRPSFIQRLQTTFMSETPELSLFEIEEETARLQRAVTSLQEHIDTANNWQGSGPGHWRNYQSLLLLEALQEEVAKCHAELQKLQLVAEQYRKWAEKHSINTMHTESLGCPVIYRRSPPVLIYSHYSELCELTRSRLRVLELKEKIYLQKHATLLFLTCLETSQLDLSSTRISPPYISVITSM